MSSWLNLESDRESSFSPIPKGVYNLIVTKAEEKETQKGDKRVNLEFTVSDGEFVGRKIFEGYQLTGSQKAVEIGRGQLKALWRCAGNTTFDIQSPDQLLNIEISASVKIKDGNDNFDDKNVISTFKPKKTQAEKSGTPF